MPRLRPRAVLTAADLPRSAPAADGGAHDPPTGSPPKKDVAADNYFGRLVAYIPAEVIAVYQAVAGPLAADAPAGERSAQPEADAALNVAAAAVEATRSSATLADGSGQAILIGLGLLLAVLTPAWLYYSTREKGEPAPVHQIVIGTLAFLIWLLAVANPIVRYFPGWRPIYATVAMVLAAGLIFPLIESAIRNRQSVT